MSLTLPTCPTDCDSILLAADASVCNPKTSFGQIDTVYMAGNNAASFTDWESQDEWDDRLANTGGDADSIRYLFGIGDMPAPERTKIQISRGRNKYGKSIYSFNFKVDEISDTNYELMRYFQCHPDIKLWYQSQEYNYGDNDGIENVTVNAYEVIPESDQEIKYFMFEFSWEAQFPPDRTELNPVA